MSDLVRVIVENVKEMQDGFELAQKLSTRWQRSSLARSGRRIVREFRKEWLSGPPGIEGGQFKKGKHVFSRLHFGRVDDVEVGLSRILRVHEEGAVIVPRRAPALYLSKKTGKKGEGELFAVVGQVKIPARTGFRLMVREAAPDVARRAAEANADAIKEAMRIKLKRVVG